MPSAKKHNAPPRPHGAKPARHHYTRNDAAMHKKRRGSLPNGVAAVRNGTPYIRTNGVSISPSSDTKAAARTAPPSV